MTIPTLRITCDAPSHGQMTLGYVQASGESWHVSMTPPGLPEQADFGHDRFNGRCPSCGLTVPARWERLNPVLTKWVGLGFKDFPLQALERLNGQRTLASQVSQLRKAVDEANQ